MNRDKQFIYDFRKNAPKPETIDSWLKRHKHGTWLKTYRECLDVKTKHRHRHRRSLAIRDLRRLYKCALIELNWAERSFEQMNFWSQHGMACKWVKKHRIYVYCY